MIIIIIALALILLLSNVTAIPKLNKQELLGSVFEILDCSKIFSLVAKMLLPLAVVGFLASKQLGKNYNAFKIYRDIEKQKQVIFNEEKQEELELFKLNPTSYLKENQEELFYYFDFESEPIEILNSALNTYLNIICLLSITLISMPIIYLIHFNFKS